MQTVLSTLFKNAQSDFACPFGPFPGTDPRHPRELSNQTNDPYRGKIVTPIIVENLESALTNYDIRLKTEIISGFKFGFKIGFTGVPRNNAVIQNSPSTFEFSNATANHFEKEIAANRFIGPFDYPPFDSFQINPINIIPKKEPNKFRVIVNLPHPEGFSINNGIPDLYANVSYSSLSDAIKLIIKCGKDCFLSKSDIKNAFRNIPVHPSQHNLLGMTFKNKLYFDVCLPMGLRSSSNIFEKFSTALQFICKENGIENIVHYLDDFLIINKSRESCQRDLDTFLSICAYLGVPIAKDKTFQPSQVLDFLGYEINTCLEIIKLPLDKINKCINLLQSFIERKKCKLRELQSLLGLLMFTTRVVMPGRAFLKRLYAKTANKKPHYFIHFNAQDKADFTVWIHFLTNYNGISLYKEHFFMNSQTLELYTDSSISFGCGGVFKNKWFSVAWPSVWYKEQNITLLELLPILMSVENWAPFFANNYLKIFSDNQAIVACINNHSSNEKLVMCCIRHLYIMCLKHNIYIAAYHVSGSKNQLTDALSRSQIERFRSLHPTADLLPSIPQPLPTSMNCNKKCNYCTPSL